MTGQPTITTEELDARFDAGEDVSEHFDWSTAVFVDPNAGVVRQVGLSLPEWVVEAADAEARRVNVPRRSVLNMWLAEKARSVLASS